MEDEVSQSEPAMIVLRFVIAALALAVFVIYVAFTTFATLLAPPFLVFAILPFGLLMLGNAPKFRCVPSAIITPLLIFGAALLPLWPVYLHLKLGPLPIVTPPRLLLYALTLCWVYDMTVSPIRRGYLFLAIRRSPWISGLTISLFGVSALSVVLAEGRSFALQEFLRQTIIWLVPFLIYLTYVRRLSTLRTLLTVLAIGGAVAGAIAIGEILSGSLLANFLSPLIADDANWLRVTQSLKARDGVFRAQATHTHPLSLGEYLAFCAPLTLAFAMTDRHRRALWVLAFVMICGGVLATNARGAMLAMIVGLSLYSFVMIIRFVSKPGSERWRPFIGLLGLAFVVTAPVTYIGVSKIVSGAEGTSAARSSQARIDQITTAWPKIIKRPVGGYGTGRSARIIGYWGRTLSVDNYYLSLAVDFGIPGPILFLSLLLVSAHASRRLSLKSSRPMRMVLVGLASAIISFVVMRMILSQTGNLGFMFPVLGAFAGASVRFKNRKFLVRTAPRYQSEYY